MLVGLTISVGSRFGRSSNDGGIAFGKTHSLLHDFKKSRPQISITLQKSTDGEAGTWETQATETPLQCKESICTVTEGSSRIPTTDAVWFDGSRIQADSPDEAMNLYLPERQLGQIWILAYEESPCHQFLWQTDLALSLFNMSVTPHWVPGKAFTITPFGLKDAPIQLSSMKYFVDWKKKTRIEKEEGLASVMWIASQCGSSQYTGRMEYMKELMKHIKVDSMGACHHNKDLPASIKGWGQSSTDAFYKYNAKYKVDQTYSLSSFD